MKRFAAVLLAVFALPLAASAQSSTPYVSGSAPVSINSCGAIVSTDGNTSFHGLALLGTSNGIQIQFTNTTPKTANLINFAVNSNGSSFVIRDVGTFSPGIEITHKYRNGAGQSFALPSFIAPKIQCTVDSVHFTDGSVWRKDEPATMATPEPPPASGSILTASPTSVDASAKVGTQFFMVTSREKIAGFSERDTCQGIAQVSIVASGGASATYSVKPVSRGSCTATVRDEDGHTLNVPINVQ